jgi:outer membrane immunogenic protein
MRKFLLAGFAVTVMAGGVAVAADMPVKSAGPAMVRAACAGQQWNGGYIGVHGGFVYHNASRLDSDGFLTDNSGWNMKEWGGIAGGQLGWNWANCNTFWGVEIDGSWVGVDNTFVDNPNAPPGNTIQTSVDALVTARMRTGVALDNLLLYITGGIAAADISTTWTSPGLGSATFQDWELGWVAGFGTEWAWSPNWSLKSEVLYVNFSDRDQSATFAGPVTFSFRHSDEIWISRIGINYRWGGR